VRAQHVRADAPPRFAAREPAAQGERDRHADDEQERREHDVHERHPAAAPVAIGEVHHPVRHDLPRAGDVVHVDHREHHQAAQGVDGGDAG